MIPVSKPLLNGNEKKYLNECLETGWISSEGPFVHRFETEFANLCDRRHGIAVSSGSAALDVAVAALGLSPGDEVIMPTFTIISCAQALVRAGLTPVLVEADPLTWNMDLDQVEGLISARTRAIMAVHIYGLTIDMLRLTELAARHQLRIIEDAAQAIGQHCHGRPCGSFGDLSVFSFYSNKHLTTGEGGMVVSNDDHLAGRCRSLRNLCLRPEERFRHEELGWNYRMTNLQAALGCAQLEKLADHLARKGEIARLYDQLLAGLPIQRPLPFAATSANCYWVYGLLLDDTVPLDGPAVMARLAAKGVASRPFFWPMHEQPVFRKMGLFQGLQLPVAERLARRGFYLPTGPDITNEEIAQVAAALREILR
ncbi:MAG: DegT/DnrJ/EryC1/StrS family aminotransferase [Desulfobulbaceae bacterium]|nr:DegT/DnrJ/EryC1/StrS family aminotransferase [Desulfobulbaceae bacterium]